MTREEQKKLKHVVERVADLERQRKDLADEVKEIISNAAIDLGKSAKAIKQMAKEANMSEIDRIGQKLYEQELDECRLALGMLSDTPLGEAAQDRVGAEMVQ